VAAAATLLLLDELLLDELLLDEPAAAAA